MKVDMVLAVLVEAFTDDPLVRWLFPEPQERHDAQLGFYRALLTHPGAEADLAADGAGAAIWLTLAAAQAPYGGEGTGRLRALGDALAQRHPDDEPHLYLPCMGVVGARQGSGVGSAMLRRRLARADADGLPVHLEASSARSRALYLRHGFADTGDPVRVADSPPVWPMQRRPSGENR
jgi:GNAT superfamily N-acetyltransferase